MTAWLGLILQTYLSAFWNSDIRPVIKFTVSFLMIPNFPHDHSKSHRSRCDVFTWGHCQSGHRWQSSLKGPQLPLRTRHKVRMTGSRWQGPGRWRSFTWLADCRGREAWARHRWVEQGHRWGAFDISSVGPVTSDVPGGNSYCEHSGVWLSACQSRRLDSLTQGRRTHNQQSSQSCRCTGSSCN